VKAIQFPSGDHTGHESAGSSLVSINFLPFDQVAFAFQVTSQLLVMGLSYALIMGLVGGPFPALRAARLPIPSALREL
jgi:putative ABC transport system permease protein